MERTLQSVSSVASVDHVRAACVASSSRRAYTLHGTYASVSLFCRFCRSRTRRMCGVIIQTSIHTSWNVRFSQSLLSLLSITYAPHVWRHHPDEHTHFMERTLQSVSSVASVDHVRAACV